MMAAITAAEFGNDVTIIEKNSSFGKKLLITGKGRCNITSSLYMSEFIKNTPGNGQFLYSAFQNYTNTDIIEFLKRQGLEVKEERGNRIFPVTDKSIDVLKCFENRINELKIKKLLNTRVEKILIQNNCVISVRTNNEMIKTNKVILATGGRSYPLTGSTGDGYIIAENLGHKITPIKPSLVPLVVHEKEECKKLQGLSLRNVKIKITDLVKSKIIYDDFGEMIFTHFGISGPIILSGSAHLVRYKDIGSLLKDGKIKLQIDLKPALSESQLDDRILRDFKEFKNKQFKHSLDKLLPQKIIPVIIEKSGIDGEKRVNEITKEERKKLISVLKDFELTIKDFRPVEEAIITSGGIDTKEINPKTMESKIIKGLYFAGEIIDVDSYTGGFNLQIAYSTGYTAGMHVGDLTVQEEEQIQIVEKKSKFIAEIHPVSNIQEVENKIKEIKKKYYDAKHHCIAYRIIDEGRVVERASDDGEPSGTAGAPMLNLLKGNNLCNVVVVVTRYFGGILLGTGGLVRAYSEATNLVIQKSKLVCKTEGYEITLKLEYNNLDTFTYYCKNNNIIILNIEYAENISIKIEMETDKKEILMKDIENKKINVIEIVEINRKLVNKVVNK